jgi:hypothetical protein
MKNVCTLGMRSTQLSESLNKDMKSFLKCDLDIARFSHILKGLLEVGEPIRSWTQSITQGKSCHG